MSVCPGCGRCRQCGQPAPVVAQPHPWWPASPYVPGTPIWVSPYTNYASHSVLDAPKVTC